MTAGKPPAADGQDVLDRLRPLELLRWRFEIAAAILGFASVAGALVANALAASLSAASAGLVIICVGPLGRRIATLQGRAAAHQLERQQRAEATAAELQSQLVDTRKRLRAAYGDIASLDMDVGALEQRLERANERFVDALAEGLRDGSL